MVTDIYRVDKEEKEAKREQRKLKKSAFWILSPFRHLNCKTGSFNMWWVMTSSK